MPRSVAEIGSFITMLRVACEDANINQRLERILALPDDGRRTLIHTLVSDICLAWFEKVDYVTGFGGAS